MKVVAETEIPAVQEDAEARYKRAVELAEQIRAEWEAEGRPLTLEYSNGNIAAHPLVKMLREAELECEKFSRPLQRTRMGRKPTAVLKAGSLPPPLEEPQRMRRVK